MQYEITHPCLNSNRLHSWSIKELTGNFILHFTEQVITYPSWYLSSSLTLLLKLSPGDVYPQWNLDYFPLPNAICMCGNDFSFTEWPRYHVTGSIQVYHHVSVNRDMYKHFMVTVHHRRIIAVRKLTHEQQGGYSRPELCRFIKLKHKQINYAQCFVVLCCDVVILRVAYGFALSIYPYFSGLLCWHCLIAVWLFQWSNHEGYGW